MPDDAAQTARSDSAVMIPQSTRDAFPELIGLILQSESMDDDERQYWVDMLPNMTPDQMQQLRSILISERDQLAAIDASYAAQSKAPAVPTQTTEERMQQAKERAEKEDAARKEEEAAAENVLKEME